MCTLGKFERHVVPIITLAATAAHIVLESVEITNNASVLFYHTKLNCTDSPCSQNDRPDQLRS